MMCGIAGWIAEPVDAPTAYTLASMLDAIAHRGPDGQGMCRFQSAAGYEVALGHRRLAIIDPDGAPQPMCDSVAGLAVVFNGEIYNFRELRRTLVGAGYRFARDSDTEVLLRAYEHWGRDVVHHLRGMFAFAVWDARHDRLFLARDRFGEKPLFIHQSGESLYFASEIKALLRVPDVAAGANLKAVWSYLAYRYVPAPETLFTGIRKLMPGTVAVWECGTLREERYWTPPDRWSRAPMHVPADAVSQFRSRLDEAVRLQMTSDVPFGAFLSGGLDSSTIVAMMCRHNPMVRTFSVGFREARYSELPYAAEVARHFGTRHEELVVSHLDFVERLAQLVVYRDAPVSEPSDIPIYMLACAAARSVKMVLTGEGSDELLGGYPKHVVERIVQGFQLLPGTFRHHLLEPLSNALPYDFRRIKTAVTNLNIEDWRERYVRWFGALNSIERERLTVLRLNGSQQSDGPPFDADPGTSTLRRILYFDQASWLPDNLLERADRMTMAASLEARAPFLDHELAAFVSSLPDRYRVRRLCGKWILREAGRGLVPESVRTRPKVGFRVPVNEWFRGRMRDYLLDHLQSTSPLTRTYYDTQVLDHVLAEHVDGRQNHEKLLWTLLNLEIWHRSCLSTASRAPTSDLDFQPWQPQTPAGTATARVA
jgi:asparagine synthase (glutamine-hydrolysing)